MTTKQQAELPRRGQRHERVMEMNEKAVDTVPVLAPGLAETPVRLPVEDEIEAVTAAMREDGPDGAELIIMVHRNGRMTMRAEHPPMQIAMYLMRLAEAIATELSGNEWPEPPTVVS